MQIPRVLETCNVAPRLAEDANELHVLKGNPVHRVYKAGLCKVVSQDSSDDDSVGGSNEESGKSEENENLQVSSSGYVESHSDSDADEEKSGNEDSPNGPKRRVLRRRKSKSKSQDESPGKVDSSSLVEKAIPTPSSDKENDPHQRSGAKPEPFEPNTVMNELSNLVQRADNSPMVQDVAPNRNLLDNSDAGSYSSRMSTKSEKNMADFDGEESICEDEMMQSITQNQLVELSTRSPV